MKKAHIIALIAIIAAIAIIISASQDVSTYATFSEASRTSSKVKVTGELDPDYRIDYDAEKSPNTTTFHMLDLDGESKKVILKMPKPQDFELSESVVVTGKMEDDIFVADEVLLKCPSKYKDEELKIRGDS